MSHSRVTVVMYHLVRETNGVEFPLKAITPQKFNRQLDFLQSHYSMVSADSCRRQMTAPDKDFPTNAALLTFDDGYRDHYDTVLPNLVERNLPAIFFPSALPVTEQRLLPYNKIQFILSRCERVKEVIHDLFTEIDRYRSHISLPSNQEMYQAHAKSFRFDSAEIIFVKRMLQRELPWEIRLEILERLFRKWVTHDESGLAQKHYLSLTMAKEMVAQGYEMGVHGWDHPWFTSLDTREQGEQCQKSLEFLQSIGASTKNWPAAYPYGAHDSTTSKIFAELGCSMAFSTEPKVAELSPEHAFRLPRLDTNDFPS